MSQKGKNYLADFSETDAKLMRELLETYQGIKMMSRLIRWTFLVVLVFVVDVANLLDNVGRLFSSLKKGLLSLH